MISAPITAPHMAPMKVSTSTTIFDMSNWFNRA
jgi:hypothetical protein